MIPVKKSFHDDPPVKKPTIEEQVEMNEKGFVWLPSVGTYMKKKSAPKVIKRYDHGGVHYDLPEEEPTGRELRKQKREDEEGMIPARFRNRGQEGLDAYIAMMQKRMKRKRERDKRVRKRKNNPGPIRQLVEGLIAGIRAKQSEAGLSSSASGAGSGCEKDGSCGALGKP